MFCNAKQRIIRGSCYENIFSFREYINVVKISLKYTQRLSEEALYISALMLLGLIICARGIFYVTCSAVTCLSRSIAVDVQCLHRQGHVVVDVQILSTRDCLIRTMTKLNSY